MRRYIGYPEFVQRDQRSLVGTALLLTGSHEQAIRLALRSLRTVGLTWPPTPWEDPAKHAHIALYRRFLRKPTAAGTTALVRLPPQRRVLVVACLHNGMTRPEMAAILGIPLETVESEITEAVAVLSKGNADRLATRLAATADEASVPDLAAPALRALRRRRRRGALLAAVVVLVPIGLVAALPLIEQGEVWNSALGRQNHARSTEAPAATRVVSSPAPGSGLEPGSSPGPWQAPRTSFAIRYAVPGKCPDDGASTDGKPTPSRAGKVTCAGWTLKLAGGDAGRPALESVECERPGHCESTVNVPDAAQHLAHGDDWSYWKLNPAVSPDGHRIAYLSAAERRYVAHDLRSGQKRYLSPALAPADTEAGTRVSVSPDGRHFTVELGGRRLRTDFTTGTVTTLPAGQATAVEEAADWLRQNYRVWRDSPSGRHSAAIRAEKGRSDSLHIIDARSRRVFRDLQLPSLGDPTASQVVGWLNTREVVIKMTDKAGGDLLGFFRVNAVTGQMHRVTGLPDGNTIVLGAMTKP
ncbi:sigma factor-like helix-turn-helix DNA-binding protein [Streptosporangium sp. NPDC000396]|uniref:RNA polymerase sigma factor n=1 Tax=Streptosporangium sp. NPDC000396 TaxID=3366185 RepID=UPI00367BB069